jgi:hypothetical protein
VTDGDRLLDYAGVLIGVTLVLMVAVLAVAFVDAPDRRPTDVPNAEWSLERANDTHVRLTHAGGEPVPADRLVVTVDGYTRRATWSETVVPGESAFVRANADLTVRLLLATWRG